MVNEKQEKVEEQIISAAKDVMIAKTGEEFSESPLEELRRVNQEMKETAERMKAERERFEKVQANLLIGGRSFAGQQPPKQETPQEKARRLGKEAVERFYTK